MATLVKSSVDKLELGRVLAHPIYSTSGVLLLSAGNEITFEHVRKLRLRGISTVIMDSSDTSQEVPTEEPASKTSRQEPDDLKPLITGAGYSVCNSGPPVRNLIAKHGRKSYSPGFHQKLSEQRLECREACKRLFENLSMQRDVNAGDLRELSKTQLAMLTEDLESTLSHTFSNIQNSSADDDSVNTAVLGMAIAIEMGMDSSNAHTVGTAGYLLDAGKIKSRNGIFLSSSSCASSGGWTLSEKLELQRIPGRTLDLLEKVSNIPDIVRIVVYQAHERIDGSGYPRGLTGNQIHVFSRTLQVACEYNKLLKGDGRRPAMSPYQAMEQLLQLAHQRQLDPEIVRRMLHLVSLFPIGSSVLLSDGSTASVVRGNGREFTSPVVKREFDNCGLAVRGDDEEHLIDLLHSDLSVLKTVAAPGVQVATAQRSLSAAC